ncbi:tRNA pseudouridine(55) synthase TruB [Bacillus carboniphilus]|uniref:tRNA pseudouridine synthase B n=1 Tax=Bacillus carboniphilus TaxID=86663 RepID=A0ABY9JY93_9BACI|nr:tRNA pseudouridine(55) synthase TruB [Bacillus carboniphilus]WLR43502.1 tRNA pseudouridine(55) synthase TruB [Bacillus carboniphilus]
MDGVILLHKPVGMTSHDCVMKARKILHTKKVGHTGTLDPDVSGVLPLCVGRGTKIVEYLLNASKTYEAEVTIGISTTTEDQSGKMVDKVPVIQTIDKQEIEQLLKSLQGKLKQKPPMYSAVKVNGKKLYEYARKGIEVDRPERQIEIYNMDLLSDIYDKEDTLSFSFRVHCSKGTYVRTLAVMIGEKLGYPAHMSHLKRVASGTIKIDECISFEELEQFHGLGQFQKGFLSISDAIKHLPKLVINDTLAEKVKNGILLSKTDETREMNQDDVIAVFNQHGTCLAIYQSYIKDDHLLKPVKVLI